MTHPPHTRRHASYTRQARRLRSDAHSRAVSYELSKVQTDHSTHTPTSPLPLTARPARVRGRRAWRPQQGGPGTQGSTPLGRCGANDAYGGDKEWRHRDRAVGFVNSMGEATSRSGPTASSARAKMHLTVLKRLCLPRLFC